MQSVETGVYGAEGQPDLIVLYGGELTNDPNHTGPWIQWRFPWEDDADYTTTIWFQFEQMLKQAGYKLKQPLVSVGFQYKK